MLLLILLLFWCEVLKDMEIRFSSREGCTVFGVISSENCDRCCYQQKNQIGRFFKRYLKVN